MTDHAPAVAVPVWTARETPPAGTLSQAVEKLGDAVIPAFQVETPEEADAPHRLAGG